MPNIYLEFNNCYGIQSLKHTFAFDTHHKAHMIYAPNGVMKTSFANTISDICKGQETKDFFYPERPTTRILKYDTKDGEDIATESIFVVEPYSEKYKSDNAAILLADETLKLEYDSIHNEIQSRFTEITSKLIKFAGKKEPVKPLCADFNQNEKDYYNCLESIYDRDFSSMDPDWAVFKYGDIVNADSERIFTDPTVLSELESYIAQYDRLLNESRVFKPSYNHTKADSTLTELKKNGFFTANHRIMLSGDEQALDEKEFSNLIEAEKQRIIDIALAKEFEHVDKLLSAKLATQQIRDLVFAHKELIPELANFSRFKQKLWVSYLMANQDLFNSVILTYKANKEKLKIIEGKAKEQRSEWNGVVEQFNVRFINMPFKLDVVNKEDVILHEEMPSIKFTFNNLGEEKEVPEQALLDHISSGEKRALYLLNIIFEIEARKKLNQKTFLVLDDIVDSFDYKNKYAIIEYIKEICDDDLFMPIILTHNFDFYRTVAGRIGIKGTSHFIAHENGGLKIEKGEYFENVFQAWSSDVYHNDCIFISAISFVRNIIEYLHGTDNTDYGNLTSLLHYKLCNSASISATEEITVDQLEDIYYKYWGKNKSAFMQSSSMKVIDLVSSTAKDIFDDCDDQIHIENKIVLSIAIRLYADKYMIARINDRGRTDNITKNQTRILRDMLQFDKQNAQDMKIYEIIERVLIITSENIHINSFMYEPIIDVSLDELKKLYSDVKTCLVDQQAS